MTRRNRPEEALHRTVAHYLRVALPEDAVFHHSPNGGGRSRAEAGIFKALGTRAGWPDIEIVYQGRALFIELKAQKGTVSKTQKATMDALALAGAVTVVCRSVPAVEGTLRGWGVPLKARVA